MAPAPRDPVPPVPVPLPVLESRARADAVRAAFGWPADRELTCEDCPSNAECEFAFDPYNTQGDCLALK
jgi:hypothetical protein